MARFGPEGVTNTMAMTWDEFMNLPEDGSSDTDGKQPLGGQKGRTNKWSLLFEPHPQGGGPFGGRNNALTCFTGFLRAKRVPFDAALPLAQWWSDKYMDPPFSAREIKDTLERQWVQWAEGNLSDLTPDELNGVPAELEFMTVADMAAWERETGAMTWLLENVLPDGGLVYFSAPPAGAKTWVMQQLAVALTTGTPWLGKYDVERRNVLYIDEEMGVLKTLPRLRKLGMPENAEGFYYTNKIGVRLDFPPHVQQIAKFVETNNIGVVIVDTLTRVHSMDENDNSQMRHLFKQFSSLMALNCTVIVAHHDRKKGADSDVRHERMRGAGEIAASADMAYSIDKIGHMFRLSTSKGRLVAEEDQITVDFVIEDNEDNTRVDLREVSGAEKAEQRNKDLEERILAALMDGPASTRELTSKIKGRTGDLSSVAKAMADAGTINRQKAGLKIYYCLPGTEMPEIDAD
jgi:hypothetical protein